MSKVRSLVFAGTLVAVSFGVVVAPSAVHAGTPPAACIVPIPPSNEVAADVKLPSCADIAGLCIDYVGLTGASRIVHGRDVKAGGAQVGNCGNFDPECVITVHPSGPARSVHSAPSRAVPGGFVVGDTFDTTDCFDLPRTGTNVVVPGLYLGFGALAIGFVLMAARRRRLA